jgi:hypothetical protein
MAAKYNLGGLFALLSGGDTILELDITRPEITNASTLAGRIIVQIRQFENAAYCRTPAQLRQYAASF